MIQTCRHCQETFEIREKEVSFFQKFGFKPDGVCFECGQKKRLCFRNERCLYNRKCDFSGEEIISVYSPDKPYKVYKNDYWYSDQWDPLAYGQDIDFHRPFFEQFKELQRKVPRLALSNIKPENSSYCNSCIGNKNCYLVFGGDYNEDTLYGTLCMHNKNCIDIDQSNENQLCYMLGDALNCYGCQYVFDSKNCTDCYYLSDCTGCHDCILCVNLSNASFCIHNKQYTKEEYVQKKKELLSGSSRMRKELFTLFSDVRQKRMVKYAHTISSQDCIGEYIKNSKNCQNCFDISDSEDLENIIFATKSKDCFNCSMLGDNTELCYQGVSFFGAYHSHHSFFVIESLDIEYCDLMLHCKNCFGCAGLRKKEYCILNKQYSKEEYFSLRDKIIEYMKRTPLLTLEMREKSSKQSLKSSSPDNQGIATSFEDSLLAMTSITEEWGEFFPPSLSCFGYNETTAYDYYPLSKEQALQQGFLWSDYISPSLKTEKIIPAEKLPDHIKDIPDDILDWTITCERTNKPFVITKQELKFYREHDLPLPRRHQDQRHADRMALRNPRKLWTRQCDCRNAQHQHLSLQVETPRRGVSTETKDLQRCNNIFQTTYAPDRSEIVYCEECYVKEVY